MAKDGSADTAVGVAKIIPKEHYFTFKFVNLLTIASTDYMVIANEFKKLVLLYDAKLLVYDANGVNKAPAPIYLPIHPWGKFRISKFANGEGSYYNIYS